MHPQITPYKDLSELQVLKNQFFSNDPAQVELAIRRVKAYSSKMPIPHSLDMTSLLAGLRARDSPHLIDETTLQLSYTMTMIKFVNGLLDPIQQSNYAIPLHLLAQNIQLPSYFVELRHIGTHEFMPSLEILRICASNALKWLQTHYWNAILTQDILEVSQKERCAKSLQKMEQYKLNFKEFKRIRKSDMDKSYKHGDASDDGKVYWGMVKSIRKLYNDSGELFVNWFIFKYALKGDPEKAVAVVRPLLQELGLTFNLSLLQRLATVSALSTETDLNYDQLLSLGDFTQLRVHDSLIPKLIKWFRFILTLQVQDKSDVSGLVNDSTSESILRFMETVPSDLRLELLLVLRDHCKDMPELIDNLNKRIEGIRQQRRKRAMPDLSDLDSLHKRLKSLEDGKGADDVILWEVSTSWKPYTPFGHVE